MSTTSTYDAFLEACGLEDCPVCRLEHAADLHYLDRLFYELVNDLAVRQQLRASLGFCAEHTRMAMDEIQGKALGLAIIYDDLLRVVLEEMSGPRVNLNPGRRCPACDNRDETTGWVLAELSRNILQEPMLGALRTSQGLCFGHLRQAFDHLRAPEKRKALLAAQREIMERLRGELAEYIRKNDYRFSGEAFGPERDSWRRAGRMGRK